MFAVAWGGNEFTPLLVMYREVSHFSTVTVDVLLGAYVVGIIPALLAGGPLSDRYGRRPLMLPAAPLSLLGSQVDMFSGLPLSLFQGQSTSSTSTGNSKSTQTGSALDALGQIGGLANMFGLKLGSAK